MGPWNPWLHEPRISKAIWDLTMAMTANATLPDNVRQIVILVVGARYDAAYAKAPDSRKGNEVALQINEAERLRKRATRDRDEERYPFGERQSARSADACNSSWRNLRSCGAFVCSAIQQ